MGTNKSIKEFQEEFGKLYIELRESIDCDDLDVFIHQNCDGKVVCNLDIH